MIAFTCSFEESCVPLASLVPLGITTARIYYFLNDRHTDDAPAHERINEAFQKACPKAEYIMNVKLDYILSGHPSHGIYDLRVTGDAYGYHVIERGSS